MRQLLDQRHATIEAEAETYLAEEGHDAELRDATRMVERHDEIEEGGQCESDDLSP